MKSYVAASLLAATALAQKCPTITEPTGDCEEGVVVVDTANNKYYEQKCNVQAEDPSTMLSSIADITTVQDCVTFCSQAGNCNLAVYTPGLCILYSGGVSSTPPDAMNRGFIPLTSNPCPAVTTTTTTTTTGTSTGTTSGTTTTTSTATGTTSGTTTTTSADDAYPTSSGDYYPTSSDDYYTTSSDDTYYTTTSESYPTTTPPSCVGEEYICEEDDGTEYTTTIYPSSCSSAYPTSSTTCSEEQSTDKPYLTGGDQPYPTGGDQPYPTGDYQPYPTGGDQPYPTGGDQPYPTGGSQSYTTGGNKYYPTSSYDSNPSYPVETYKPAPTKPATSSWAVWTTTGGYGGKPTTTGSIGTYTGAASANTLNSALVVAAGAVAAVAFHL